MVTGVSSGMDRSEAVDETRGKIRGLSVYVFLQSARCFSSISAKHEFSRRILVIPIPKYNFTKIRSRRIESPHALKRLYITSRSAPHCQGAYK